MPADRLTLVLAPFAAAPLLLPFASERASRIAPATTRTLAETLGTGWAMVLGAVLLAGVAVLIRLRRPAPRLGLVLLLIAVLVAALAHGAGMLSAAAGPRARISPAAGFWTGFIALVLLGLDARARLDPPPLLRMLLIVLGTAGIGALLASGVFAPLSIMVEYANRRESFWAEAATHLRLVSGAFVAALLVGFPLGIALYRSDRWRPPVLAGLTAVQTIPSMALFGLLILPLGWLAREVPFLGRAGLAGIGAAPALLALFLYALLPVVANTVAGLASIPASTRQAAAAMGMTPAQAFRQMELPLALPVLLAGARIVLVQSIGLATVGALIGAGGFGVFVFQGLGQTAVDLILLGVFPTVALAFVAAGVMDAAIAMLPGHRR